MLKLPTFKSIKEERKFWQSHNAFEILNEDNWEVVEAGTTEVRSVFTATIRKKGATVLLPKEWLNQIGAQEGQKIKAWTEGKRLIVELA